jgi:hypothetical protein
MLFDQACYRSRDNHSHVSCWRWSQPIDATLVHHRTNNSNEVISKEIDMASARKIVTIPGTLSGQGHEAQCIVQAIKVTAPGGGVSAAFTRLRVVSVSQALPEGVYQLSVNGAPPERVRYSGGNWLDGRFLVE